MKDTVTLKELFAIIVRRGKQVVCLMLAFALLLGIVQTGRKIAAAREEYNSPEKIEERYQDALEDYQQNRENLEERLFKAQQQLEGQQEYNDNSLLLEIDPYNKAVTSINFAITDVDTNAFQQVFQIEGTPIDFIISKIQSQYLVFWNSLDLQAALKGYSKTPDKYLREMVTLVRMDGGGLTLTAAGSSEQEAEQLANAAYACLLASQPVIAEGSYAHNFTLLSKVTKVAVDQELEDTQKSCLAKIDEYTTEIGDLTQQLEELTEPQRETGYSLGNIVKSVAQYMVMGAVLGAVLGMAWAAVAYLFRDRIETSRQLEQGLSVPFLGTVSKQGDCWNRLADRILGERNWTDAAQAQAYLTKCADIRLPQSGTVALVSTLSVNGEDPTVQAAIQAVGSQGRAVRFVGDVSHAPEAVSTVRECDYVVLAERAGVSCWSTVAEAAALAKSLDKPVSGFVMI